MAEPGVHYVDEGLYDGGSLKIYRDGVLVVEVSNDGSVTIHTNGLKVGTVFGCNGAEPQSSISLGSYPASPCSHCGYSSASNLANQIADALRAFGFCN